jgi:serine/threonine protein kinase
MSPGGRGVGGRYSLDAPFASGGMATVHFGQLLGAAGFARAVAIKRLHAQFVNDPEFVAMFLDEARLAARIRHPNVVPTLDVVSADGQLLLVMEYVHGESLSRLLLQCRKRGERMPPPVAAAILAGVLRGLHAAHEARGVDGKPLDIVHRDVSPQNVMVGVDGVARVLDFGVAKASSRMHSTREGLMKGKLSYMAPEQFRGLAITRQTDVYAASVVLWEALAGERLFEADNEALLMERIMTGSVRPPSKLAPDIPPALDAVVMRALDASPAKRFADAREMAAEIEGSISLPKQAEVGEWVERCAGPELAARARRIQLMERGSASGESVPLEGLLLPPTPTADPTLMDSPAGASTRADRNRDLTPPPLLTGAARPARPWLVAVGGVTVAAACIAIGVAVGRSSGVPTAGSTPQPPAAPPPSTSAEDLAGSASSPVSLDDPSLGGELDASAAGHARWPAIPPDDCKPPYVRDDAGRKIYKRSCLHR